MSKPSDKPKSDRQRVIEWYKEDIYTYNEKIKKYSRLVKTIRERTRRFEFGLEEKSYKDENMET